MGLVRAVFVLVALVSLAAAAWFFMRGKSEQVAAEAAMAARWKVWVEQSGGGVDVDKLNSAFGKSWNTPGYKPVSAGVTPTPFHAEFGHQLRRSRELNEYAAIALAGDGLVMLLLAAVSRGPKPAGTL
jgi:hypothetical protein